MGPESFLLLTLAAVLFLAGGLLTSKLFTTSTPSSRAGGRYECGIPTKTSPLEQFNVDYYLFPLLFLSFDVELLFLSPWAVVVRKLGLMALVEMALFLAILFVGF